MPKLPVMIHGFGNVGKNVLQALEASPDMQCIGVLRRTVSLGARMHELRGVPDFSDLDNLIGKVGKPAVVFVCGPSRKVPEDAARYLAAGLHTVDSFDIHSEISSLIGKLDAAAKASGKAAVTAAGWDPGTDSVLRALFEAMAPTGTTFTNFGRGRSMGHSVAARAVAGVADAVSITIPTGGGRHSRLVYVLSAPDATQDAIRRDIAADPYFNSDPLEIRFVDSKETLQAVADDSHGVLMERTGASGFSSNQQLRFDMRINNPALTGQVLVAAARAATRMAPGCYTLIDIPPVALLPGERLDNVARLV
ncbi:MAG: diaminopimelate dehydrogenase [Betaproteobacteria bacterium]|nr:diaminopimelate dehydrogenase [Betaproteobacteria bacterium]